MHAFTKHVSGRRKARFLPSTPRSPDQVFAAPLAAQLAIKPVNSYQAAAHVAVSEAALRNKGDSDKEGEVFDQLRC